jgi:hypothetical protein
MTLGMSAGPQMSIDASGNLIAPASITSPILSSSVATGVPPLTVASTTPVANLTLAAPSQVPTLPESQITNLAADLAARVSSSSPALTGKVTQTYEDETGNANYIMDTIRKFGKTAGSASNGSAIWNLGDPAAPSGEYGTEIESNSARGGPYRFGSSRDSNIINRSGGALNFVVGRSPAVAVSVSSSGLATFNNGIVSTAYGTESRCSSKASPAACGSATAGKVRIPASAKSLEIDSTAFTANTGCWFTYDTVGLALPANMSSLIPPYISARMPGSGIVIRLPVPPLANAVNLQFGCEN